MTVMTSDRALSDANLEHLHRRAIRFEISLPAIPMTTCAHRYHVPELFALERAQLLGVVELFRANPGMHSEVLPVLGNKGAGKTHLLHSIKHGSDGAAQLLVTPGTYQKDTDFLEYLLFQVIDTLLGGGKQKGRRPLETISEELGRRLVLRTLQDLAHDQQVELFPAPGLGRWMQRLGLGSSQATERTQWLIEQLNRPAGATPLRRLCAEVALDAEKTCELVWKHLDRTETHNTAGMMRRHIYLGLVRAAIIGDESELANFLTYGFAEIDYKVKPSRQELVLAVFRVLMEAFGSLNVPVVIAFDQLEDLLLARRTDDGHRIAESFFAGLVQAMHQLDGICFLIFAERGLWNRFVPSLDGYIQDRLNNPVHVPGHGTVKALRLEAPTPELVRRVVEERMRPNFSPLPCTPERGARGEGSFLGEARPTTTGENHLLTPNPSPPSMGAREESVRVYPFTEEQVQQVARTEPTLRDMLQQFRQLFDHLVYGVVQKAAYDTDAVTTTNVTPSAAELPIKSAIVVEVPAKTALPRASADAFDLPGMWEQALAEAQTKLRAGGIVDGGDARIASGAGSIPANLPRTWRQGRPVALAARGAGIHLQRASNVWGPVNRPLGV